MPHLRYTLGDSEAVKACIALSVSGAACDVSPTALPRSIGLDFDEKGAISDSNAIARYLGELHTIASCMLLRYMREPNTFILCI